MPLKSTPKVEIHKTGKEDMITQIYEIQTPQEAEKCIELGVDQIGSVLLSQGDWRVETLREVTRLCERTEIKSSLIPLFRDSNTLYRAIDYYRPHFIHFCEGLTDGDGGEIELDGFIECQSDLKQKFPEIGIMRSIPVPEEDSSSGFPTLSIAMALEPVSDIFLTDTWLGKEPVKGYIGITGTPCDWEMARELVLKSTLPVILAGGLSPENVYDAVVKVFPFGADSCTQTNLVDGAGNPIRFRKDFRKVEKFVKEVRSADAQIKVKKEELENRLKDLKEELREREAALPAHSIRPHQLIAIEELEEEIVAKEKELEDLGGRE
jgi:phosphoribosylanthranilate isomerase